MRPTCDSKPSRTEGRMELCVTMTQTAIDDVLIAECQAGDRAAFRRLYDAYQPQIYSTALSFMRGDATAAEDITQDVFVKLFGRIGQFRSESAFTTWLHRLTVNTCLDELRKRKRFIAEAELQQLERVDSGPGVHDEMERQERVEAVKQAVS